MVEGVVQRHAEKDWGTKKFFSFTLSGQDGWYNSGVKRPPAVGTSIRFDIKKNSKGYLEVDGPIEILADGETAPAGPVATVARQSSGVGTKSGVLGEGDKRGYYDRKEARDITNDSARELGASRNTAIALIDVALKYEVFKLPAPAKREEFLWTLLEKYTNRLMGKGDSGKEESTGEENKSTKNVSKESEEVKEEEWN